MKPFNLKTVFLIALTSLSATASLADAPAPWDGPAMKLNSTQRAAAQKINAIVDQAEDPTYALGFDPKTTQWDWRNGLRANEPLSNLTQAGLQMLLSGNYYVARDAVIRDQFEVFYFDPGGKVHQCLLVKGKRKNQKVNWRPYQTAMGFFGLLQTKKKKPKRGGMAWPTIYDDRTGDFTYHNWTKVNTWNAKEGWIQDGYSAVFAEICPKIPRSSLVYANHTGTDFDTLAKQAKNTRIRMSGITVFRSDYRDPLTAEMYYSNFPPDH